jgi:hypothetical protein
MLMLFVFASIAPACDNYSDCLSCCYRIHQKYCFVDKKTGSKGIGAAGVQFWKWMLESGPNVEEAIVRSKAVPLVHTANNTDQIRAVTFTSNTIHCAHPPDPITSGSGWVDGSASWDLPASIRGLMKSGYSHCSMTRTQAKVFKSILYSDFIYSREKSKGTDF